MLRRDSQTPEVGVEADDSARGEVLRSAPCHPHVASGRPHRDRAVSCRKRCRAVPSAAHCLPAPGAIRPSPQHSFRITLHTLRSRARGWTRVPKLSRSDSGKGSRSRGSTGGERPPRPTSLLKGGRKETSRIQRAPTLLASPPGAPSVGVEGSQAENTAPSPSLRAEPAEGLKAQHPVPVRTPDPRPPDSPSVPRKLVLYLKPQPQPRPHPSPPPRSSGTGFQGLDPN